MLTSDSTSIKAIVFDMDGTLFDTEKIYFLAYRKALVDQGLSLDEDFYHQNLAGTTNQSIEDFFQELHGVEFDRERYKTEWPKNLHDIIEKDGLPFMPEIRELLDALKDKEIPLAVASSSDHAEIEYFLTRSGIRDMFTVLAAGDEVKNSKPAPDIFLLAAERLDVSASACLAIEDSNHGVKAASDAAMKVLMTPGPAGTTEQSIQLAELPVSVANRTLELIKN